MLTVINSSSSFLTLGYNVLENPTCLGFIIIALLVDSVSKTQVSQTNIASVLVLLVFVIK
jgi:hypothetical protein